MLGSVVAFLAHFSPLGIGFGLGGIAILAIALLGLNILPKFLVRPAILVGGVMLAGGLTYQIAYARATHAEQLRGVQLAIEAEATRANVAEAITRANAAQASRDLEEISALNRKLLDLTNEPHPSRDRVCVDRDLSRRLRGL